MKTVLTIILGFLVIISCDRNDVTSHSQKKLDYYFESVYNLELSKEEKMQYLDSARSIVDHIPETDSLKMKNVFRVANRYYALNEFDGYFKYSKIAQKIAESNKDSLNIAKADYYLGDYYFETFKSDSAYYYYTKAKKEYEAVDDEYNLTITILHMSRVLLFEKDYLGCETLAVQVLKKAEKLEDQDLIYQAYTILGRALAGQKNFDKAIEYYGKALGQIENIENEINVILFKGEILNNLGHIYLKKDLFDKAKMIYEEALKEKRLKSLHSGLYTSLLDYYAYTNFKLKNKKKALLDFEEALAIRDSIDDVPGKIKSRIHLAEYYLSEKDTSKAYQLNQEAYTLAKISKYNEEVLTTLNFSTRIDPDNGLKYAKEYIKLSDSLQDQERNIRNKLARIEYETDEILEEKDKISSQKEVIQYGSLIIVFFGLMLFIIFYQRNKQKQLLLTQQQQQANEEIYQLMLEQQSKLDYVRTNEKKRIARELHDGVMNKLASTRLNLFVLNRRKDEDTIEKCLPYINGIQEIEKEVRGISHELVSKSFSGKNNFDAILDELCKEQEALYGTNCIKDIDSEIKWDVINASIKMNLYRIIQEALNNINKYANAQNIIFRITLLENKMILSIEDDGKGFNVDKAKRGIGLKNIKERAENIDGQFEIFSEIGFGTKLTIKLNLTADHE
ncbi:ATP-binding protein [Flavobacterium sp. U410]